MSKKRIGILTSGGDCPGLNAVIRGSVKACHQLGYDCVGFLKGYEGLHDPVQYVHLTQNSTRGILNQGGTILGSTNKGRFAATVGVQDRKELDPDLMEGVKQTINQLGIDGLICVGGDGSLAVAQQFHEQGIPVVGVPKTIDNDLSATAFTFGFDSAIECATDALDRLHTTAASHERIMVLEVMGRHAGWIALHSGIAGGGDIILIPEVEWSYDNICHKILHRESQGKKFTLVVVAEGAHLPDAGMVGEARDGQQMKLGGVGRAVAEEIERRLHRETRLSVLGHLQRGGSPTTFDRVLATQFGAHAVRLVKEGRFGEMICSRPPEMTSVPIMEAVNVLRQVDPHGPAVQAARALGISFGDRPADEIGQDIFDRRGAADQADDEAEPIEEFTASGSTLTDGLEAHEAETPEPTAVVESTAVEADAEIEAETTSEETAVEITAVATEVETPAVETPAVAEPAEATVSEALETTDTERAESGLAEASDEAKEPVETDVPAEDDITAESDEDLAVEQVAETMLDLVADADTAAHGPVGVAELVEETADAELPADAPEATAEEATAEEETSAEETATDEPADDFADAQSLLTQRIAAATQAAQANMAEAKEPEPAPTEVNVAELVKQKLAEASLPAAKKPEPVETPSEAPSEAAETLASPADQPFEEDLLAEARSALEEALTD